MLNEVCAAHIALKQGVVNHDALDAGPTTGLEQARQRGEVGRPVGASHGFNHLDRTDGVKRRILDITVVLQPQVSPVRNTQALQSLARKGQLFGAQRDPDQRGTEGGGAHLRQCAPAAADLQNPVAGLDLTQFQGTPHLGRLRFGHGLVQVAGTNSRRVIHGVVQPKPIKSVAQVVVGVNIFLAVGSRVAVEEVLDAVKKAACP